MLPHAPNQTVYDARIENDSAAIGHHIDVEGLGHFVRSFAPLSMTSISCRLLLFPGMFRRKLDKHIFERRADLLNLGVTDPDATQLFIDLCALDAFIDQQVHRLSKDRSAAHTTKLMHGMEGLRHMVASHIEPPRPWRIDLGHFL